jgi:RES domain
MDIKEIPIKHIAWKPSWRIIPSRFPPIALFERVTNAVEYDTIYAIEALTNPRLQEEIGELHLVPREERLFGEGTSYIMAAFTHLNPTGSRFTDGSYGVYYAAHLLNTAIIETKYHREKFFRTFKSPKIEIDMRVLLADLSANLHDISGMHMELPDVYDKNSYVASQTLAKTLKTKEINSYGIHYDSVRDPQGKCVAIFRPKALSTCRQERHLCYVWDGEKISHIYRKSLVKAEVA